LEKSTSYEAPHYAVFSNLLMHRKNTLDTYVKSRRFDMFSVEIFII
jgi:hypothetical protein